MSVEKIKDHSFKILPPKWIMYPNIPFGSIGWRMGYGEAYGDLLFDFFEHASDEDLIRYYEFFPVPDCWGLGFRETDLGISGRMFPDFRKGVCLWGEKLHYEIIKISDTDLKINTQHQFSREFLIRFDEGARSFISLEHYILFHKGLYFGDEKFCEKVEKITSYKKLEKFLRDVPENFDFKEWQKVEYLVFVNGNYYKFTQNKELLDELFYYVNSGYIGDESDQENNFLGISLYKMGKYLREIYKNYNTINFEYLEENGFTVLDCNKNFLFKNL